MNEIPFNRYLRFCMEEAWRRRELGNPFYPVCWRYVQRRRELVNVTLVSEARAIKELKLELERS